MIKSITREKVFHVLKLVLLAVTVTLVLLSLLGTVAHASGLVDDTVNADNLYSKYPLSNYQLDFYVDNSWSWLPWNWLDGIGKSVQYGLYCITNFVGQSACILAMPQDMWCNRRISWTSSMTWQTVSGKVSDTCRSDRKRIFQQWILCGIPAHYHSDCRCLYRLYRASQKGNQQGTSRCYQLCGGVHCVCVLYCLCSQLYPENQ